MKPILFSTPMVRALLEGRKTQTRRVIDKDIYNWFDIDVDGTPCAFMEQSTGDHHEPTWPARFHKGDIMYVRETWAERFDGSGRIYYKADDNLAALVNRKDDKWRPSLFMPKGIARLFLMVTDVRAERLQNITEDDARAEGIGMPLFRSDEIEDYGYVECYERLWDSLNAKRGYGWDKNPWVWVYTFEQCEKPTIV